MQPRELIARCLHQGKSPNLKSFFCRASFDVYKAHDTMLPIEARGSLI